MILFTRLHPNQKVITKSKTRFRVVAAGRRFGKTEVGKRQIILSAIKGKRCWWLSPTYQMASQVWRDIKAACAAVPGLQVNETERRLDFPGGGFLAIRSAHLPDTLRGAGLDFVVLDEAAFMTPDIWPQIIRPMLLESKGHALFLSSPNGRNWFWEIYNQGLNKSHQTWRAFHFTSYDNPQVDPAELAAIAHETPERVFQAEYLAEFTDDSGQVFRGIRAFATAPLNPQPIPGGHYVAGIDWGREDDYTAIVVINTDNHHVVALDRFNQVGWSLQRGRLAAICARWNPSVIWAESNSIGSVNIEALQAEGLPVRAFTTTTRSKGPLIEALALAIERAEIALLSDQTLLDELAAYTIERLPSGGFRYTAPPGSHDDTIIALALAWHGLRHAHTLYIDFI